MSSSGDAAERAVFKRACAVLAELQDDMDWKNVMSKFKVTAAKWAKSLKKIERQGAHRRASAALCLARRPCFSALPERLTLPPCVLCCTSHRSGRPVDPHEESLRRDQAHQHAAFVVAIDQRAASGGTRAT